MTSNLIDFLEKMGNSSLLRYAGSAEIEQALLANGIGSQLRAAVLSDSAATLQELLGANTVICCVVHAPDDDEEQPDDDDREEDGQEQEDDASKAQCRFSPQRAAGVP